MALCGAIVLGAMTWLTRGVLASEAERLRAEKDRGVAEARADLEERTRLALWRMDAIGAGIVLRENLVRVEQYRELPTAGLPSAPEVLLRFEIHRNPQPVTSETQAVERLEKLVRLFAENPLPAEFIGEETASAADPAKRSAGLAEPAAPVAANAMLRQSVPADQLRKDDDYQRDGNLNEYRQRARVVGRTVQPSQQPAADEAPVGGLAAARESESESSVAQAPELAKSTPAPAPAQPTPAIAPLSIQPMSRGGPGAPAVMPSRRSPGNADAAVDAERSGGARGQTAAKDASPPPPAEKPAEVRMVPVRDEVGLFQAVWLGGELFVMRKITPRTVAGDTNTAGWLPPVPHTQGVWLDAAALTAMLLREVADLLPQARLTPALDDSAATDPLALVSFPFKLDRNEQALASAVVTTPVIGMPLWIAWGGVLLAFLTTAALLFGVIRLSERRASFVSAVTHELRTPLTTFRLYSDMLEQGVVKPEKQAGYLTVLAREADRLSHLVENVLTFSRIERGNARANIREVAADELLESFRQRFESRLDAVGLRLVVQVEPGLRLRADLAAVEHILFNLIDNTAKYAASSQPPEVRMTARQARGQVEIVVIDDGPGISPGERTRIFRPFHKSAAQAAETKPGVGLGLALSRRLARAQQGDLLLGASDTGACFLLRLPLA